MTDPKEIRKHPLFKWLWNRVKSNKNALIVINGETGSGKSYASIYMCQKVAEMFGTQFSVADNMSFSFDDLFKKMSMSKNESPGTPFLFEEVGAMGGGAASREWQSKANKLFFTFMQTARHRNQVLFMTCPHFHNLEKGARNLVHLQMETYELDIKKEVCLLKCYRLQVNKRTGKIYFKYLRFADGGGSRRFQQVAIPEPGEQILEEYEKFKDLYSKSLAKLLSPDKTKKEMDFNGKFKSKKAIELHKAGWKQQDIADLLRCTQPNIARILREWRNKQQPNNITKNNTINVKETDQNVEITDDNGPNSPLYAEIRGS